MPHIFVTYRYDLAVFTYPSNLLLARLAEDLPVICAEWLSSEDEGGELTKSDFSVTFHKAGDNDVITHPLQIRVETHSFPLRLATIDQRTEKIRNAIKSSLDNLANRHLKGLRFYVWVRLSPAGFSTGELNPI